MVSTCYYVSAVSVFAYVLCCKFFAEYLVLERLFPAFSKFCVVCPTLTCQLHQVLSCCDVICDVFWHLRSLDVSQLRRRSCTLSDCMEEVNCRHRDGLCDDSVLCSLAVCITVDPLSSLLHSDSLFLAPDVLLCKNPTTPFRLNGTIASLQG